MSENIYILDGCAHEIVETEKIWIEDILKNLLANNLRHALYNRLRRGCEENRAQSKHPLRYAAYNSRQGKLLTALYFRNRDPII